MKLSPLTYRALFFVFSVLFCELALLLSLYAIVCQSEQQTARAQRYEKIANTANSIGSALHDAAIALYGGCLSGDNTWLVSEGNEYRRKFTGSMDLFEAAVKELQKECSDDEEDAATANKIQADAQRIHQTIVSGTSILGQGEMPSLLRMKEVLRITQREYLPQIERMMADLRSLKKNPYLTLDERNQDLLNGVKLFVCIGAIINVLIALTLSIFFGRGVAGRLRIVTDNTRRFAEGVPLHESLSGTDEIAELDRAYHRMAQKVTEARKRERSILDSMPVGIFTCTDRCQIQSANPRLLELTGHTSLELLGTNVMALITMHDLRHEQRSSESKVSFDELVRLALHNIVEVKVRRRNGSEFAAELTMSTYEDEGVKTYNCSILDITARYEADRLKREFVSIVSHDLRTPLTSIMNSAKLLSAGIGGELNDRGQKIASSALIEGGRLLNLVSDLLTMARVEAGKIPVHLEECWLFPVLEQSVNSVSALAERTQVQIQLEQNQSDFRIFADADRLVQVFVNLLSNAIKYSPAGGRVVVQVKLVVQAVQVSVIDEGCGVPESARHTIFQRFEQGRTSDASKGYGLGLHICKMIIDAHSGEIGVDSQENHGSEFWVRIPLAAQRQSHNDAAECEPIVNLHSSP